MRDYRILGDESKPDSPLQLLAEGKLEKPVSLDSDPTTALNQLPKHGDTGYNGAKLFIRLGDNIYKFTGTLV